jgi:peptidyl-prolyl cis-trans isomerase C
MTMRWLGAYQSDIGWCSKGVLVLLCVAIFGACDGHGEGRVKSPVVVLVNDRPITASQLNQVMQAADPVARAQAVESLVNEELLVQGAEKQRIERDPRVAQAIEASRRQILARAFAERNLYSKQKGVSATEAQEFYRANPILFEKRKRFLMKDYSFDAAQLDQRLTDALENVHSDADLDGLLYGYDITYSTQADSISADKLPLDKLGDFEHASVGDVVTARQGSRAVVMLITDIQDDAPLSFVRARPYIEAYLTDMHNRQALSEYLSRAKTGAKIVYADVQPGSVGVVGHDQGSSTLAKADGIVQ